MSVTSSGSLSRAIAQASRYAVHTASISALSSAAAVVDVVVGGLIEVVTNVVVGLVPGGIVSEVESWPEHAAARSAIPTTNGVLWWRIADSSSPTSGGRRRCRRHCYIWSRIRRGFVDK